VATLSDDDPDLVEVAGMLRRLADLVERGQLDASAAFVQRILDAAIALEIADGTYPQPEL
jgi:hypothetical protein